METKRIKKGEHEKVRRGVGRRDGRQGFHHGEVVNISTNPVLIVYAMGEHKAQKRKMEEDAHGWRGGVK